MKKVEGSWLPFTEFYLRLICYSGREVCRTCREKYCVVSTICNDQYSVIDDQSISIHPVGIDKERQ